MSFVNLMANDVWSEADITHRTEALLHGTVSKETELILSRKMIGYSLGLVIPTAQEAADLTVYEAAAYAAQQAGVAARADMALLASVLNYEAAQARLALPLIIVPVVVALVSAPGYPAAQVVQVATITHAVTVEVDEAERAAARAIVTAAGADTRALVALRIPPEAP